MTPEYKKYLQTDYWKSVSDAVRDRAGRKCQTCNGTETLQAHHRSYEHLGSEMEHLDDLICLCQKCHRIFHSANATPPKPKPVEDKIVVTKEFAERIRLSGLAPLASQRLNLPLLHGSPRKWVGKRIPRRLAELIESEVKEMEATT